MAAKTTKLTSPNGGTVSVAADKVEGLLRRGFTEVKATTQKASSSSKKKS